MADETKGQIRVWTSDRDVIGRLADSDETQADVVRDLLDGNISQEQIDAARRLAQTDDHDRKQEPQAQS